MYYKKKRKEIKQEFNNLRFKIEGKEHIVDSYLNNIEYQLNFADELRELIKEEKVIKTTRTNQIEENYKYNGYQNFKFPILIDDEDKKYIDLEFIFKSERPQPIIIFEQSTKRKIIAQTPTFYYIKKFKHENPNLIYFDDLKNDDYLVLNYNKIIDDENTTWNNMQFKILDANSEFVEVKFFDNNQEFHDEMILENPEMRIDSVVLNNSKIWIDKIRRRDEDIIIRYSGHENYNGFVEYAKKLILEIESKIFENYNKHKYYLKIENDIKIN